MNEFPIVFFSLSKLLLCPMNKKKLKIYGKFLKDAWQKIQLNKWPENALYKMDSKTFFNEFSFFKHSERIYEYQMYVCRLWMLQQGEPAMYTDTVKLNPLIVCVDDQSHECSSGSSVCFQYSWKRNQYILYGIANHKRIREKIHEGNEISDCWLEKSRGWLLLLRWFVREISNRRDLCNSLHQE